MRFIEAIKDRIQGKAPKGAKRSKLWRKVRKEFIKKNPSCALCGSTKKLQAHHILPFHLFPDLELEESNLITLCEHGKYKGINCHLAEGHLLNYSNFNPYIVSDAKRWRERIK